MPTAPTPAELPQPIKKELTAPNHQCHKPGRQPETLASGRDHPGTLGDIIPEYPGDFIGIRKQGLTDPKSRCMHACCGVEVQSKDTCTGDLVSAESSGQEFESCRPHQQVC